MFCDFRKFCSSCCHSRQVAALNGPADIAVTFGHNAIELEGYNLDRYTKFDVLLVLWTQILKQMNFACTRLRRFWCYFSPQLSAGCDEICYCSECRCLATEFGFVWCRAKVQLYLFCRKGQHRYIIVRKKIRTGFKETFILIASEPSELSK